MRSRYDAGQADQCRKRYADRWGNDLADRVYTSRLLGADASLVLHGGGNASVKTRVKEITGQSVDVLYVKGSGWDLIDIEPEGYPACRLSPLLSYCQLERMSDEQMVSSLRSQLLDPSSPTPSVEALLHAFLPGKFVDHTHADAVLSLIDQPDGRERARSVWGDDMLFIPYVMPGFDLARRVKELFDPRASYHTMVLGKHGIFTWGDDARQSYERMIQAVSAAEQHLQRATEQVRVALRQAESVATSGEAERRQRQRQLSPLIRGALARGQDPAHQILEWRDEPEILALLARPDARDITQRGPGTPDHVIRTKPVPVWLGDLASAGSDDDQLAASIESSLAEYARWYERYFEDNTQRHPAGLTRLDRRPRLLAVPGLGLVTVGKTRKEAHIAGDLYVHTSTIIATASELGEYRPVTPGDLFDVEYWSLEQAKLKNGKSAALPFSSKIAVVTGAASGIGLATAELFLSLGAHVVLADRDEAALTQRVEELQKAFPRQLASAFGDLTEAGAAQNLMNACIDAFGGVDIVVSNAGIAPSGTLHTEAGEAALEQSLQINFLAHQHVARAASNVMLRQKAGGCLLFNASKSAFNPGPGFGPYAVAKSALVALMRQYAVDLGSHAIRSNAINADRIRTGIFSEELLAERARARGTTADEYFRANLLRRETRALDVARGFAYLAQAEATTGAILTIDGGNAAAFPR